MTWDFVCNIWSIVNAFTVAAVPTGIKAGVSMTPLLVWIFPNLAPLDSFNNSNEIGIKKYYLITVILSIISGSSTDPDPGSPFFILSTNSIPESTLPKTV